MAGGSGSGQGSGSGTVAAQVPGSGGTGTVPAGEPLSVQSSPSFNQFPQQFVYPSVDSQYSMHPPPLNATSGGTQSAPTGNSDSFQSFNFPRPSQEFFYPTSPVATRVLPAKQRIQHSKNNLSISSHFNLFNLKEEYDPSVRQMQQLLQQLPQHKVLVPTSQLQTAQLQLSSNRLLPLGGGLPSHSQSLTHQTPSHLHSGSVGTTGELLPPAPLYPSMPSFTVPLTSETKSDIIHSLLIQLPMIDGQNINSYLLDVIHKFSNQLPLDEFYNILYNSDEDSHSVEQQQQIQNMGKIDNTVFDSPSVAANSSETVSLVLRVFKNPMTLTNYISTIDTSLIKLTSVNYHELLRTFLAIKILSDILIQLPGTTVELEHTIPRLSIYKTYYIVCQKLINSYPSSSNTVSEQQKIILGQSKLGKLIKMVYPNLRIKRLGSRGESKYNYLGVVWNENIVHPDISALCENNELSDLNTYFMLRKMRSSKLGKRKASGQLQNPGPPEMVPGMGIGIDISDPSIEQLHHSTIEGGPGVLVSTAGGIGRSKSKSKRQPHTSTSGAGSSSSNRKDESYAFAPQLSFTNPFLKFPTFEDFSLAPDLNQESWFDSISKEQALSIDNLFVNRENISILDIIQSIFIDNLIDVEGNSGNENNAELPLLNSFMEKVVHPYAAAAMANPEPFKNVDLRIYLITIIKLLPYLLLLSKDPVKSFDNHGSFLQTLRSNLIQFVNNFSDSIFGLDSVFPHTNATIFCIILKKLINVNDLLITFIKLIMKEEGFTSTRNSMKSDIQNYLISPSPSLSFENNEIRFNFKEDIVQNDLIFSLMGYNYNPTTNIDEGIHQVEQLQHHIQLHQQEQQQQQGRMQDPNFLESLSRSTSMGIPFTATNMEKPSSVVSMKFVREEATLIEQFFKVDLVRFLSFKFEADTEADLVGNDPNWINLLSSQEYRTLTALIKLMHESLLSTHFKSRYPILVYHNFISCILNDLLKHIYSKQQIQLQVQLQSSFGNWWVFNSFVEEYVGLMGEIVGLFQTI